MKKSPERVSRAKQLRADGWTLWEIGHEFDISEPTARLWCDDAAAEAHRLYTAQLRQPIQEDEARQIIAKLAGRRVIRQPAIECTGEWADGLHVRTTDGGIRHVDEINLPVGLQRRRLHKACRTLAALSE